MLAIPLVFTPAGADSALVSVTMDDDAYSVVETAMGGAPVATVRVTDSDGLGLAGVEVRVAFIRQVQLVGYVGNETVMATTGADGSVQVAAPVASGIPGNYLVVAFASGTSGSARYSVGA